MKDPAALDCLCEGKFFRTAFRYDAPPEGETRFALTSGRYEREFRRCALCGHYTGVHEIDLDALYSGDYVGSTYGADGLRRAFDRINALPPAQSDNAGRAARVQAFAAARWPARTAAPTILDVGSGLCVFLHRMKAAGWIATALDPDPRAAQHARDVVGITAIHGDFRSHSDLGTFDVITFNKVLEHVPEPVPMLARAIALLSRDGFVYVEVPDGEAAAAVGPGREEFFVDHWHAFSPASLALLVTRAGLRVAAIERLREPSGKFTLRAFAVHS